MPRVLTPELMDQPGVSREDLAQGLRFIRLVNRRFGGAAALIDHLRAWSVRWPRRDQGVVTLLDVATGSADIPAAAVRWARRAGFDLRITAVDLNETTLDLAREYLAREAADVADAITLERANALDLTDRFAPASFDYAHAGMFLHHLPQIEVLTVLRMMERIARRGLVWNDLMRNRWALFWVHIITIGLPHIPRHDARVSVRAGFSRAEVEDFAARLELGFARYRASLRFQRFTLAGEREFIEPLASASPSA